MALARSIGRLGSGLRRCTPAQATVGRDPGTGRWRGAPFMPQRAEPGWSLQRESPYRILKSHFSSLFLMMRGRLHARDRAPLDGEGHSGLGT